MTGVGLYHCADEGRGFFVKVEVDYGQEQPIVLRSFVSSVPLEDYSHYVRLPGDEELACLTQWASSRECLRCSKTPYLLGLLSLLHFLPEAKRCSA
jgi:hypothetical protein